MNLCENINNKRILQALSHSQTQIYDLIDHIIFLYYIFYIFVLSWWPTLVWGARKVQVCVSISVVNTGNTGPLFQGGEAVRNDQTLLLVWFNLFHKIMTSNE